MCYKAKKQVQFLLHSLQKVPARAQISSKHFIIQCFISRCGAI